LIYLASPFTDRDPKVEHTRYLAAAAATAALFAKGLHVYSPIAYSYPLCRDAGMNPHWPGWYTFATMMLVRASAVYVLTLPGWRESRGVRAEVLQARGMMLPISGVDPTTYAVTPLDAYAAFPAANQNGTDGAA